MCVNIAANSQWLIFLSFPFCSPFCSTNIDVRNNNHGTTITTNNHIRSIAEHKSKLKSIKWWKKVTKKTILILLKLGSWRKTWKFQTQIKRKSVCVHLSAGERETNNTKFFHIIKCVRACIWCENYDSTERKRPRKIIKITWTDWRWNVFSEL